MNFKGAIPLPLQTQDGSLPHSDSSRLPHVGPAALAAEAPCRISFAALVPISQRPPLCHGRSFTLLLHRFIFLQAPHHKSGDRLVIDTSSSRTSHRSRHRPAFCHVPLRLQKQRLDETLQALMYL